eukprot:TRINITY_DN8807_c0_g1_i4.p1 TRINITY_DN8807_c0_g1~~TRINITY_DN8807_c0_g1_i4.p1  ORF type:complete len:218 (+),score=62.63 TRINITY_DN8807_c0_g1_i4:65-718(+)
MCIRDSSISVPFNQYVVDHEDKEMELTIFNVATQQERKCTIVPRKWEGEGLLGFVINQEDYKIAHAKVVHIVDLLVNGPMYNAGLKPKTDYIIGTEHYIFGGFDDFSKFVGKNDKQPVNLFVYNSEEEKVRLVTLIPDKDWGGAGALGGDIAFGLFHALPIRKKKESGEKENVKVEEKTVVEEEKTDAQVNSESAEEIDSDILIKGNKETEAKAESN